MADFQDLHQKHVLGALLSTKELQQLEVWYAMHDMQEDLAIFKHSDSASTYDLKAQINILFEQITQELIQIRKITQENNEIKNTNEILKSKLIQSAT